MGRSCRNCSRWSAIAMNTVREEYDTIRPAFRWRQIVGLARVTANVYGYNRDDQRSSSVRATKKPANCSALADFQSIRAWHSGRRVRSGD